LTCKSDQIIETQNQRAESASSPHLVNSLAVEKASRSRDTFGSNSTKRAAEKVSRNFSHKSIARDNVLKAIKQYRGWVKSSTVATKAGISLAAAKKQLQRLRRAGFVDGDGGGRYRKHRDRKQRKLKPCRSKPIQRCRGTGQERKSLTRGELKKRGWHENLIDRLFPKVGKDYKEKEFALSEWSGRIVKTRIYRVSRIKAFELEPWFEIERAELWRRSRTMGHRAVRDPRRHDAA
jgi:ribosomal protein S25